MNYAAPHRNRLCHDCLRRQDGLGAAHDLAETVCSSCHRQGRNSVIWRRAWNNDYWSASWNCRFRNLAPPVRARRAGQPPNSKVGVSRLFCAPEPLSETLAAPHPPPSSRGLFVRQGPLLLGPMRSGRTSREWD